VTTAMSQNQTRTIDPVLTGHIRGMKQAQFVGQLLFPFVPVHARGGTVLEFDDSEFVRTVTRRAPGSDVAMISFGYSGKAFQLENHGIGFSVPVEHVEDAGQVLKINLSTRAAAKAMQSILLGLESAQAALAFNSAHYTAEQTVKLTGSDSWFHADSNPLHVWADMRETVRSRIGQYPNRGVMGPKVFARLKDHPVVTDRFKHTTSDSITVEMLARLLDLDKLAVGTAIARDSPDGPVSDVWGNGVSAVYAPPVVEGREEPSWGYTYRLEGYPFVEKPFFDARKRSWLISAYDASRPLITGQAAGFYVEMTEE